jgi:hypothetical protein
VLHTEQLLGAGFCAEHAFRRCLRALRKGAPCRSSFILAPLRKWHSEEQLIWSSNATQEQTALRKNPSLERNSGLKRTPTDAVF